MQVKNRKSDAVSEVGAAGIEPCDRMVVVEVRVPLRHGAQEGESSC